MKKVLIADDRKANYIAIKTALEELRPGCEMAYVANGREAVQRIGQQKPDLVLMDMLMPQMDGMEATKEIRKQYSARDLPIIAMTAQDNPMARQSVLNAGCNEYLQKPYTLDELMKLVDRFLGKREA